LFWFLNLKTKIKTLLVIKQNRTFSPRCLIGAILALILSRYLENKKYKYKNKKDESIHCKDGGNLLGN
jgi:hypothetical protein